MAPRGPPREWALIIGGGDRGGLAGSMVLPSTRTTTYVRHYGRHCALAWQMRPCLGWHG